VKYSMVSIWQLLVATILMSILVAVLVSINSWYMVYSTLPKVHFAADGSCLKVENFQNGQAFNCNDVGVLLRQYRSVKNEKVPAPVLHDVQQNN
jgi:hypothetical protein